MKLHKHAQLLLVLLIGVPVARAQQSATIQSSPAAPTATLQPENNRGYSTPAGSLSDPPGTGDSLPAKPDIHVLSGAETLGLGALRDLRGIVDPAVQALGSDSLRPLRGIFDPGVQVSEFGETGIIAGRTLIGSSLGGSLDVQQYWDHYHLTAAYRGAETIYRPSYYSLHYLPYHDGSISQEVILGRWTLRLRDDALYSWAYGFSGQFTGGPAQVGNGLLNSIQPSLVSSGTIETGLTRQLYNTAVGEIDYARSRQTTLTVVSSYALAHFLDPGYINSQGINVRAGYNYALSAKNNIALIFDHDRMSFAGTSSHLQDDSVQMAFGRNVTGRLAFQLAAGPRLVHFENFGAPNGRQLSWSAFGALTYQWTRRTGYSFSYFRGVSAGSGVFFGSDSETVLARAEHDFTRFWSASVNGGYAINKALLPTSNFANQFNDWFVSTSLGRQIGHEIRLSVGYNLQQQTSGGGSCPVSSCSLPGSASQLGLTVQWHRLIQGR